VYGLNGALVPVLLWVGGIALSVYAFWRAARIATGLARRADPGVPLFESDAHPTQTVFVRLEGVAERNADGTSRQELIRRCVQGEPLRLEHQPPHWDEPERVGVFAMQGGQLGWLDSATGAAVGAGLERGLRAEATVAELTMGAGAPWGRDLVTKITYELPARAAQPWRGGPATG